MKPEIHYSPDLPDPESRRDEEWIQENRTLFWLASTAAFEELGHGFLFVNLAKQVEEGGHPFGYVPEGELEPGSDALEEFLREYDPDREFIVILWGSGGQNDVYLGRRPSTGWYVEMRTQTPYRKRCGERSDR